MVATAIVTAVLLASALVARPAAAAAGSPSAAPAPRFPNVVVVTVDTLRADRLSAYGYRRPTTPNLDRLLARGARFTAARTAEPLTTPALATLLTSLYPHEHGATRNGLRLSPGLPSFARALRRRGFRTAAFVGNWTLRDRLSGLAEHFDEYQEVLTRKRWWGLFKGEATAADLTDAALGWLAGRALDAGDGHAAQPAARRPFLLWVHYVDPHAPYRLHPEVAARLGVRTAGEVAKSDRYDTEVAFADLHIGRLLAALESGAEGAAGERTDTLIVFAADHGESLGEHGEWGHGRTLYEPALRVPLGIVWPGHVRPQAVDAPASSLDVAPTILGLLGLAAPPGFRGFDWSPVLAGRAPAPASRTLWFQAHKGAVLSLREAAAARRNGLLAVGMLAGSRMEILTPGAPPNRRHELYDLARDPGERTDLGATGTPSAGLRAWLATVTRGLALSDRRAPAAPDAESAAKLRALGYAE